MVSVFQDRAYPHRPRYADAPSGIRPAAGSRDLLLVLRDALTADISPDIPGKREPAAIQEGMGARSQSENSQKDPSI